MSSHYEESEAQARTTFRLLAVAVALVAVITTFALLSDAMGQSSIEPRGEQPGAISVPSVAMQADSERPAPRNPSAALYGTEH